MYGPEMCFHSNIFSILTSPEQKQELGPLTQLEQGIEELVEGKVSQKLARGEALEL